MASKGGYKRKLYLIDREFQFRYLATWLLLVLSLVGGMVLSTLALFFFFRGSLFRYTVEINAGLAVLFTGLSLYYMVHHSHRIAGPAYRLECVIRQLARGSYDLDRKVYLRRKDYLKQLADALNELIEAQARQRGHARILLAGMSELDSAVQGASGLSSEVKDLSRLLFAETVDLAGAADAQSADDSQPGSVSAGMTPTDAETQPLSSEIPVDAMSMDMMDASDEVEPVLADQEDPVNDYQRALRMARRLSEEGYR